MGFDLISRSRSKVKDKFKVKVNVSSFDALPLAEQLYQVSLKSYVRF